MQQLHKALPRLQENAHKVPTRTSDDHCHSVRLPQAPLCASLSTELFGSRFRMPWCLLRAVSFREAGYIDSDIPAHSCFCGRCLLDHSEQMGMLELLARLIYGMNLFVYICISKDWRFSRQRTSWRVFRPGL